MNLADKKQLFDAFFTLPFGVKINLEMLADTAELTEANLEAEIPYPFRLATELNRLDAHNAFMSKGQQLSSDVARVLEVQNKKIDLMLSYLLMQEDKQKHRYVTDRFGAGGLTLTTEQNWQLGDKFKLKIFMPEEACAVYCYAEIIAENDADSGKVFDVVYSVIRDEDREVLVRMALHQQSKQLRQIALERANQPNEKE
ncbi:PilZ domain-containing protein [Catenovulum agarivorans]|uniref:PilZ domain-containing protein n=1 Tax=Catenovulum agarivorans TaxID=1172192 RepID=UPI000313FDFB|nr:PilZ domain-containing protein [Catenovulum agarivorans]